MELCDFTNLANRQEVLENKGVYSISIELEQDEDVQRNVSYYG